MRVFGIVLLTLVLSPAAMAEVNFVSYVKRNMKALKATETPRKVIAFEKKELYRNLASDKPATPANSALTPPPSAAPTNAPTDVTPAMETLPTTPAASATPGPAQ